MGCDIHVKTYVFSKVENKMVPMTSVFEDSDFCFIPCIVGDRFYDLFGLFGNQSRSNYPELDCLHPGLPDFMTGTTLGKYAANPDYHTHRWCEIGTLEKSLTEYRDRLTDPVKYREHYSDGDDDFLNDVIDGTIPIQTYLDVHKYLVAGIDEILKKTKEIREYVSDYGWLVDADRIVFVTWMDS